MLKRFDEHEDDDPYLFRDPKKTKDDLDKLLQTMKVLSFLRCNLHS